VSAIRKCLRALRLDQKGATAIEYALIVSLIGMAMSVSLSKLGGGNGGAWTKLAADIAEVTPKG
jgi:Flp pilus assembly pilin Flp